MVLASDYCTCEQPNLYTCQGCTRPPEGWNGRTCANCGTPVPTSKRWCSTRCYRREDEGR